MTITGTARADTLDGTGGPDILGGLGGHDLLRGQAGDDRLEGGSGNDTLIGGADGGPDSALPRLVSAAGDGAGGDGWSGALLDAPGWYGSEGSEGYPAVHFQTSFSPDGRLIAFASAASNLVGGDSNGVADIFVKDLLTGAVTRISLAAGGGEADGGSFTPVFTSDGTAIAFMSRAGNLPGAVAGAQNIFLHTLTSGTTELLSVKGELGAGTTLWGPTVATGSGRIAFHGYAWDPFARVYIRDVATGELLTVSGGGDSIVPTLSPDGTKVAFTTFTYNSFPNAVLQLMLRDLVTGETRVISSDSAGAAAPGGRDAESLSFGTVVSFNASFSPDGHLVVFDSSSPDLVAGDGNGRRDVFMKDLRTDATIRLSVDADGTEADGASRNARFSPDGRHVVFESKAGNLGAAAGGQWNLYLKDLETGAIRLLTRGSDGDSYGAQFSPDGRFLSFVSTATTFSPGDTNGAADVFVIDLLGGDTLTGGDGADLFLVDAGVDVVTDLGRGADILKVQADAAARATLAASWKATAATVNDGQAWLLAEGRSVNLAAAGGSAGWDVSNAGNGTAVRLAGSANGDTLEGGAGADSLSGGGGGDLLIGGAANDTMAGGAGNDTYMPGTAADRISEGAGQGRDLVLSPFSFVLASNLEDLTLTGAAAINGIGNSLGNLIRGNGAANLLDGRAGADTLVGGGGDDTHVVDSGADLVVEQPGEGTDLVRASVSHALSGEVEHLTLTGSGAIQGTGNGLDNRLTGNGAANRLEGGSGGDTLVGGGGQDQLIGGTGADLFRYLALSDSGTTIARWDVIQDFSRAEGDRIDLSALDARTDRAGDDAFAFLGEAPFAANAPGQLRYEYSALLGMGVLYASTDRDAEAEFAILLAGVAALQADDLVL
jgi:Tol biopolymer transport system component